MNQKRPGIQSFFFDPTHLFIGRRLQSILIFTLLLVGASQGCTWAQPTLPPSGFGSTTPPARNQLDPALNQGTSQGTASQGTSSPGAGSANIANGANTASNAAGDSSGSANLNTATQQEPDPGLGTQGVPQEPEASPTIEVAAAPKQTVDSLQAARDAALAAQTDEELKKRITEMYQKAIDNVNELNNLKVREVDFRKSLETVKERADYWKNKQQLAVPTFDLDLGSSSLAEVQAEATSVEQKVKTLKDELAQLATEQTTRLERRKTLQELAATATSRIEELKNQLQAQAPDGESPAITKARRAELQSQISLIETRQPIQALEREWLEAEIANDVNRLMTDAKRTELAEKEKWLAKVNETLISKRTEAAKDASDAANKDKENVPAALKPLADENAILANELVELTADLTQSKGLNDEVVKLLEKIEKDFTESKKKIEIVGLTDAIGQLLRKQRVDLPSPWSLRKYRPETEEISAAQLAQLQFDERRSDLAVSGAQKSFSNDAIEVTPTDQDAKQARLEADLLQKKKDLLDQLYKGNGDYFLTLVDLDTNQRKLLKATENYRNYIDERVLWIPSGKPLLQQLKVEESDLWFLASDVWVRTAMAVVEDVRDNWLLWSAFFVVFLGLKYRSFEYRRRISAIGREASSGSATTFRPTLEALFYTLLISLPWSALILFLAWRLHTQGDRISEPDSFRNQLLAIAIGLSAVGFGLLPLECLRHICRDMGLGAGHFGWSKTTLQPINRMIRLLSACGLPLVFVTTTLYTVDPTFGNDLLERICFVVGAGLLTYVIYRMLAPKSGVLRNYYASNAGGWLDRLQNIWFGLALFMPVFLAVLALTGYYYTACQLSIRMYAMFWLIIFLLIGRELIARLILVGRRRTYIEQAKLRRSQAASANNVPSYEESEVSAAALIGSSKEWTTALAEQTKQSQNLLNSVVLMFAVFGTWFIWADVVPALRVVYQQTLWTTTEIVADSVSDGSSIDELQTKEVIRNITPTDLLQSIVVLVMTFIVFRNLPGLVDIMILNRLPLDPSTRNAITAICSYLVIVIGVVWAANAIGVHWAHVQWLITAFTFGLAFGLQEIFANFVAGVIILFERPIRVGDVVTVDDVTGIVTRTRARATTIRNWDLKEYVVPNKEFITGKVLNWTLTDQVTRLVIPVGVAYGSDTRLTSDLLLEVAQKHGLVLADPAPQVTFEAFGDSTLNFVLRAYVAKLDDRLKVTNDLHREIDDVFRKNNIEIAFPQRDLHIRTMPAQWQPQWQPAAKLPDEKQDEQHRAN